MNRDDYLTLAQIARLTGISKRSLIRYAKDPEVKRHRRRMPGGKRWVWHKHVLRKIEQKYERGLALRGRPPNIGRKGSE